MIVSKGHFIQIKGEVLFRDAMEFSQSFFGVAPESFQSVNIHFPIGKSFTMVYSKMIIATEHKGIIATEFIGVYDSPASYHFHRLGQEALGSNIWHDHNAYLAFSLEDTEDRNFASGTSATLSFSATSEVRFIHFHLAVQQLIALGSPQGLSDKVTCPQNGGITQTRLLGYSVCRNFKFKELYNPEYCFERNPNLANPSSGKVMERISTSFTAVFFASQTINSVVVTTAAKNMAFFPALFSEKKTCPIFSFTYEFEGIKHHIHKIVLVQDAL